MELPHLRSLLFAPGSDARKLEKAFGSAADGVVCDLEDAVAPIDKERAREVAAAALAAASGPARLVRINAAETAWFDGDLALAATLDLGRDRAAEGEPGGGRRARAGRAARGRDRRDGDGTAPGVRDRARSRASPRCILGAVDLGAEVGLETRPDGQEILYARSKVTFDSAAAGAPRAVRRRAPRLRGHGRVSRSSAGSRARSASAARPASIPAQVETINTRLRAERERDRVGARRRRGVRGPERGRPRGQRDDGRQAGRRAGPPRAPRGAADDGAEGVARALLRGLHGRRRLPQPLRPHDHGHGQHLVHVPDHEHEPDALRRAVHGADALRAAARQQRLHARARHRPDRSGHVARTPPPTSPGRTSSCRSRSSSATRSTPRARSSSCASRSRTRASASSRCAPAASTSAARS